jgi:hypothetical protein
MSTDGSDQLPNPDASRPETNSKIQPTFRIGRVAVFLAVPVLIAIGAVVGIALGWEDVLRKWTRPKLVAVTGQVEMDGKPVPAGFVRTKFLDGPGGTALGPLDKDGRFSLTTGDDSGAFLGRHKVMVYYMDNSFPPKSLVPEKYTQPETSPVTIEVNASADRNHFVIRLDSPEQDKY